MGRRAKKPSRRSLRTIRSRAPADWWKSFFGKDYLLLYGAELTPNRSAREVESAVRAIGLKPGEIVLDLCCGFGRHLRWLRSRGIRAFGLEISPDQLAIARKASDCQHLIARGDARLLPFRGGFDAVLLMYTSMGYFDDQTNLRQMQGVAQALRPGGRLYIDNQNPPLVLRNMKRERRSEDPMSQVSVVEQFDYHKASRRIYARKAIATPQDKREYFFVLRPYPLDELKALLERCGLEIGATYGDYDLRPYSEDTERLIVAASKPA